MKLIYRFTNYFKSFLFNYDVLRNDIQEENGNVEGKSPDSTSDSIVNISRNEQKIKLYSIVKLKNLAKSKIFEMQLIANEVEKHNHKNHVFNIESPLAKRLIGKKTGDVVVVEIGDHLNCYEVLGIDNKLVVENKESKAHDDSIALTQERKDYSRDYDDEVNKVHTRVPGWKKKPHQYNSQILNVYFKLVIENGKVFYYDLEKKCKHIKTFKSNYAQMKSFGSHNHAKIFEEINSEVVLWPPVKGFIKKTWSNN